MGTVPPPWQGSHKSTECNPGAKGRRNSTAPAIQIKAACGFPHRPDSTAHWDSMAPLMLTAAPPYSLPQAQTFSIFKRTSHQKSSPPAGTQSPGPDPARSLGRGVYQEGSRGWRRMMCGEKGPEDQGRGAGGAAGSRGETQPGPQTHLLLSGTRVQDRAAEEGEDGPGGAGLGPRADQKTAKGPRRREVGEHGLATIRVQPPHTLPSGRASVLTLSTPCIPASP